MNEYAFYKTFGGVSKEDNDGKYSIKGSFFGYKDKTLEELYDF